MQKLNKLAFFLILQISASKTAQGDEKKIFPALFSQNTIFVKKSPSL